MKIKENDKIPNSEVFILENGEPTKKNIEEFLGIKKLYFLVYQVHILQFAQQNIYQDMLKCMIVIKIRA
tara:strand:- start:1586 stop:1792 length:207 start_codon:yes stop_codon:yes gene_type:complete